MIKLDIKRNFDNAYCIIAGICKCTEFAFLIAFLDAVKIGVIEKVKQIIGKTWSNNSALSREILKEVLLYTLRFKLVTWTLLALN